MNSYINAQFRLLYIVLLTTMLAPSCIDTTPPSPSLSSTKNTRPQSPHPNGSGSADRSLVLPIVGSIVGIGVLFCGISFFAGKGLCAKTSPATGNNTGGNTSPLGLKKAKPPQDTTPDPTPSGNCTNKDGTVYCNMEMAINTAEKRQKSIEDSKANWISGAGIGDTASVNFKQIPTQNTPYRCAFLNEQAPVQPTAIPTCKELMKQKTTKAIFVVHGSITREPSDAVVNAAQTYLTGGSGVDGAIHTAAQEDGGNLVAESAKALAAHALNKRLPIGHAITTDALAMKKEDPITKEIKGNKYIIHTVGPHGPSSKESDGQLFNAYYNSIVAAHTLGLTSMSTVSISTGIYAFPVEVAIEIAFAAALLFFKNHPTSPLKHISFTNKSGDSQDEVGTFIATFDTIFTPVVAN